MTGNVGWVHFVALVGEGGELRCHLKYTIDACDLCNLCDLCTLAVIAIVFSSPPYSMALRIGVSEKIFL